MTQGYLHDVGDEEIRHSVRVIKQQRNAKLAAVILAGILGIAVLFIAAYLGFSS
jgi:hypothetical protein